MNANAMDRKNTDHIPEVSFVMSCMRNGGCYGLQWSYAIRKRDAIHRSVEVSHVKLILPCVVVCIYI
jgi:hypothetical protein